MRQRVAGVAAALVLGLLASGLPAAPAPASPRSEQWYLNVINVAEAHQVSRGEGVTIGLMTLMLPPEHPDLADRVLPAARLDVGLWTSIEQAPDDYPKDDELALAEMGLMVARGGSGMLGVAPAARIRPIICPAPAEGIERCMRWLVDSGVDVIRFPSFSARYGPSFDGIRYALANDVVVVAGLDEADQMPAEVRAGVVFVGGGLGRDNNLQSTVKPDKRVTLRAPGTYLPEPGEGEVQVLNVGAKDGSGYGQLLPLSADRIAAALVTGVVALIRAAQPDLNAASVINRLLSTSRDLGDPGRDATYGHGVVDARAALTSDVPAVTVNPLGDPGPPARSWRGILLVTGACVIGLIAAVAVVVGVVVLRRRRRRVLVN